MKVSIIDIFSKSEQLLSFNSIFLQIYSTSNFITWTWIFVIVVMLVIWLVVTSPGGNNEAVSNLMTNNSLMNK